MKKINYKDIAKNVINLEIKALQKLKKSLKQKYGQPLDVVAKDKCFYFSYAKDQLEDDEDGINEEAFILLEDENFVITE